MLDEGDDMYHIGGLHLVGGLIPIFHAGTASGCMLILLIGPLASGLALGVSFSLSLIEDSLVLEFPDADDASKPVAIDCLLAASVMGGDEILFVVIAVFVAVGVERARTGGLVTEMTELLGDTFFTPAVEATGGGDETRLTRVLFPSATFPPVEAAELLPDFSMSERREGGRLASDIEEAGREGRGVLNDDIDATESRRVEDPARMGAAGVAPAVPLTPMLLLSCVTD